ncbi:MAG: hypothetical protein GOV00_04335 [Candidatus Altiarchaeota archaeon]|nr:hypothetical protein [Candidatus Altiarchaeota archaeon]
MKGVLSRGDTLIFRVNLRFYPEALAIKYFGKSFEKQADFLIFKKKSSDLSESEIYEKFNGMLEEML